MPGETGNYERLDEETKRFSRIRCRFTILMLDIDHFKLVNDSFGHIQGDAILKELSAVLKENTRQPDLVGRYGGEEFLIMLVDTGIDEGYKWKSITEKRSASL